MVARVPEKVEAVPDVGREPDMVLQIGGTTCKIFGPGPMSEGERQRRHDAVVRAVAKCLESSF
ncbi:hypothetical protein D2Q93_04170 [Alicyclobacillaceae bacterium I2511]|nr:hypothetical protein D2Q93_04170 [Alicyclobacillaceae bacterium I2511]